jgi:hypothetical protein
MMDLQLNLPKFEERQAILVTELARSIQVKLIEAGVERDKINDLTLSLAFSVSCLFDGVSVIEADGVEVQPYLTFQVDDELVHCGENSNMHELVYEVIGKLVRD